MTEYILQDINRKWKITIKRSKRKSIALVVDQQGSVLLKVPNYLTDKDIISFCKKNEHKLISSVEQAFEKQLKEGVHKQIKYDEIYKNGAFIPFCNGKLQIIRLKQGNTETAGIYFRITENGTKQLIIKTLAEDSEFIRSCVTSWLREYARDALTQLTITYASRMGLNFGRIAIREQKTRWGSCSSKRNLNFNWKLILTPVFMQEYVVVHELAHLKEMNHSKAFWREVEKILPDYKKRIEWQKEHEKEFAVY